MKTGGIVRSRMRSNFEQTIPDLFTILTSYRELENYLSPFMDAWKGGAMEQLQVRP